MAISLTYTFTANTTIVSSQVNSNFSTLATRALDKTGDTMTGDLKFTDALYDIGKSGATRPRDFFISRNASIGGTLGVTGTGSFSGNVAITGTLSVASTASLTGANVNTNSLIYGDNSTYGWDTGKDNSVGGLTGTAESFYWYARKAPAGLRMFLTPAGVLSVNGFGAHTFSAGGTGGNYLRLRNITAGTANDARIYVDADDSIGSGLNLNHTSTTFTPTGIFTQNGSAVFGQSSGGLSVAATHASGAIRFYSGGSTLRGTIDTSGRLFMAAQPGFLAYNSANDVTQGAGSTIDFDTEVYDEAGNFSGDTFTAPVTGRYLLTASVGTTTGSGTNQSRSISIVTSNRTYFLTGSVAAGTGDYVQLSGSAIADMDAGDTATVQLSVTAASTVTILGDATLLYTFFSGRLLP